MKEPKAHESKLAPHLYDRGMKQRNNRHEYK